MDLVKLLQDLALTINSLQAQLVDAQAALDIQVKSSYDSGFSAGVASVVLPPASDKIYSQSELEQAVSSATAPLSEQVGVLQAKVDEIPALVDQKVLEVLAAFKAELLLKIVDVENLLK